MRVGALILAAGAATRMGSIKQLLPYKGKTLVEDAVQQASQALFTPVVVVLGAQAELVSRAVERTSAETVVNERWQTGMGSSIRIGLEKIIEIEPSLEAVAILLADQPFVTSDHLSEMGRLFNQNSVPILAASYAGTVGVPAIFRSDLFSMLRGLPPESGARAIISGLSPLRYELPEAAIDIDTPEDYAAIR